MLRSLRPSPSSARAAGRRGASAQAFEGLDSPHSRRRRPRRSTTLQARRRRAARPRRSTTAPASAHHAGHDGYPRRRRRGHRCRAAGPRARPVGVAAEAGAGEPGPGDAAASPRRQQGHRAHDVPSTRWTCPARAADRQRLDVAISLVQERASTSKAAMAACELMKDPKLARPPSGGAATCWPRRSTAWACTTRRSGEFSKILAAGPQTKFFKTSLEWLFFISRKTKNETVILDEIARYANYEFPEKFRSEFHYLLARYHFVRGKALDQVEQKGEADKSFEEVKRLALLIPRTDLVLPARPSTSRASPTSATASEARRSAQDTTWRHRGHEGGRPPDPARRRAKTAEQARLDQDAARAGLHAAGAHALRHAAEPLRHLLLTARSSAATRSGWRRCSSPAWANYRIGQYEQALGNLITLSSPVLPRGVLPRGADPQGGHLLRELPLPRVQPHPPGLRAHLPAGARPAGAADEEEHGRQRVLQRARRRAEEEQGGRWRRTARTSSSSASSGWPSPTRT